MSNNTTYRWEFHQHKVTANVVDTDADTGTINISFTRLVQNAINLVQAARSPKKALEVPQKWTEESTDESQKKGTKHTSIMLQSVLGDLHKCGMIKFVSQDHLEKLEESTLNLNLWRTMPGRGANNIQFLISLILGYPGDNIASSELEVEHTTGAIISKFFGIENCKSSFGESVQFPMTLGCFSSTPRPDCASRLIRDTTDDVDDEALDFLQPVLFGAEAKRKTATRSKSTTVHGVSPGMGRSSAQLAWLFQPTLDVFIGHLVEKEEHKKKSVDWRTLRIPNWMFTYGVAYDYGGIIAYAFYPVLEVKGDKPLWGYRCVELDLQISNVFMAHESEKRFEAFKVLLAMRQHAHFLAQKLSHGEEKLMIPKPFKDLSKTWRESGKAKKSS